MMQRQSALFTFVAARSEQRSLQAIILLLGMMALLCGCLSPQLSYQVSEEGDLFLTVPPTDVQEEILLSEDQIIVQQIRFHQLDADVDALFAFPPHPRAAVLLAPGAGVKKESHQERAEQYAREGIAFLVLDLRGNGGTTPGYPLDLERDFRQFVNGRWPQYYAIIADMIAARQYLSSRFDVPVYAMGESNGGRYAAIAAATDPGIAGYIGVSTTGFGLIGTSYTGDGKRFLLSIDPDHAILRISPRPVLLLHAPDDSVLPYTDARRLYLHATDPKTFQNLTSGHGLNEEADQAILALLTST